MADEEAKAVELVAGIGAVLTILEVVCRTTGMGFATIARVTHDRWIACGVRDEIGFGLAPGGELKIETTICDEVREALEPVVISDVAADPVFCRHPTPAMYGFSSYVSVPVVLPGGENSAPCAPSTVRRATCRRRGWSACSSCSPSSSPSTSRRTCG